MEYFFRGYREKQKLRDEEMWMWWGNYGLSAVATAIEHNFAKHPKSKFTDKPLMHQLEESQKQANLTDDEKRKKTEQLFMRLRLMQANFSLSNKDGGD